jgi:Flp pilus assembly protein TadD
MLKKAAELTPDDPVIAEHLGDAYKETGSVEKAREQYERALQIDPERTEVKEKLESLNHE